MAEHNDCKIYGKKIFFLYSNYNFQSEIIDRLREQEFETYVINDYKKIKNILINNPGSILYIDIDSIFNVPSWFNFIDSIEQNEQFKSIAIGIFSQKFKESYIKEIAPAAQLKAGILTSKDDEKCLAEILEHLEENQAKGKRQFVRASCKDDVSAEIFWLTSSNVMYKFKIIDLSSSGIAIFVPAKQITAIEENYIMPDITLMLKEHDLKVTMKVQLIKKIANDYIAVLMFHIATPPEALSVVRTYISETLDRQLEDSIFGLQPDQQNYHVKDIRPKKEVFTKK